MCRALLLEAQLWRSPSGLPQEFREAGHSHKVVRANLRRGSIVKTFINMLKDDSGASAAEYALILAIVGATIAIAAIALGGVISNAMDRAGNCINAGSSATSTICG